MCCQRLESVNKSLTNRTLFVFVFLLHKGPLTGGLRCNNGAVRVVLNTTWVVLHYIAEFHAQREMTRLQRIRGWDFRWHIWLTFMSGNVFANVGG